MSSQSTKYVVACILSVLSFGKGFLRPHTPTARGVNLLITLKWQVDEVNQSTAEAEQSPVDVNSSTSNVSFTVYVQTFHITSNNSNYMGNELPGFWKPVKGCIKVFGTECHLEELFFCGNVENFWVASSNTISNISPKDTPVDQQAFYDPYDHMTYTAPNFTATRQFNKITIDFAPMTSSLLETETVPEHLIDSCNSEPVYLIRYYQKTKTNSIDEKPEGFQKVIPATKNHHQIATAHSFDLISCVAIRFIDEKDSPNYESPFIEVCLPPNGVEKQKDHSIAHRWVLPGVCSLLGVVVFILVIRFCSRNGKKIFRRAFSIQDFRIPEKTEEIMKEDLTVHNVPMLNTASMDVEVVDPCFLQDLKAMGGSDENSVGFLKQPSQNRFSQITCNKKGNDIDLTATGHPKISKNSCTFASDKSTAEESPGSYSKMIFYEHKPGAYLTESPQQRGRRARWMTSNPIAFTPCYDEHQELVTLEYPTSFNRTLSDPFQNLAEPKRRFLSNDSAFYDDVCLSSLKPMNHSTGEDSYIFSQSNE